MILVGAVLGTSLTCGEATAAEKGEDLYAMFKEAQARFAEAFRHDSARWQQYGESPSAPAREEELESDSYEAFLRREQAARDEFYAAEEKAWRDFALREQEAWETYVAEVEEKWRNFLGSTQREWVAYSEDRGGRSYVDFERGYGIFEVLVRADAADQQAIAAAQLVELMHEVLRINSKVTGPILQGQIAEEAEVERSLAQPTRAESVTGKDGIARTKFHVQFTLIEDHLLRRAERYWPLVEEYSGVYDVDAPLVMAIIETESAFNPRARSWANAYGLMQIVPKFAGRESWREIHGEDGIPDSHYLFDPENNIRHGSCFLNILRTRYWGSIAPGPRLDYLVICSYNCGAAAVRRLVKQGVGNPADATEDELFRLLATRMPQETREYLTKVAARREKWTVH
jgi:membrane-bound lytic murein transglycosylase C